MVCMCMDIYVLYWVLQKKKSADEPIGIKNLEDIFQSLVRLMSHKDCSVGENHAQAYTRGGC